MSHLKSAVRCAAIALGITSTLAYSGCATKGKIGQMSKFDIAKASPDDIKKALEEDGRVGISGGILFETDSAKLAPSAADVVRRISDMMKQNPNLKVAVVGHTDDTGDFNYNLQLSDRRAKAMVDALIKNGVAANRLTGVGVASLSPVAPNDTAEGRAQNRRVELVLIR
jgi:OOP family OmpA-OmpF porin